MKNKFFIFLLLIFTVMIFGETGDAKQNNPQPKNQQNQKNVVNQYSLAQAMSDEAQLTTISFSGLAFITGNFGADTFLPPGKIADFFGFQYMRDIDAAGYGHNTLFLSRAANNVLYILNDSQKEKLISLAKTQVPLYINFAYNRLLIMNAFRRNLEGKIPSGSAGLNVKAVSDYTANLYKYDADISYNRAVVVGEIIKSFTDSQKAYLAKMQFNNYNTWPDIQEDETLKRNLTNNEFVAVMTYASELFSWYKGSLDADVYYCPERHGTYFGGFFMKDYPAMNNPDYFISTAVTGDSGKEFLNILNTQQKALISGIITEQKAALKEIAEIRTTVSIELRKAMTRGTVDKVKVYSLIQRYGFLDGQISTLYAVRFAAVNKTLTTSQKESLVKLRNLNVIPKGIYLYSTPVPMAEIPNTDFMFGIGTMAKNAGQLTAPDSFLNAEPPKPENPNNPGSQPEDKTKPENPNDNKQNPPPKEKRSSVITDRYKDNGDGTITDKQTGLMWQKGEFNNVSLAQAVLAPSKFAAGGYKDWRIPSIMELMTIVDTNLNKPPFNDIFGITDTEYFWSSDNSLTGKDRAWVLNAGGGIGDKSASESKAAGGNKIYSLKCVRGTLNIPAVRFVKNSDGTITDNFLQIIWMKTTLSTMNLEDAKKAVEGLNKTSNTGWRLPTMPELALLADRSLSNPAVNKTFFSDIVPDKYWTSTVLSGKGEKYWFVDFKTGMTTYDTPDIKHYIIAVKAK